MTAPRGGPGDVSAYLAERRPALLRTALAITRDPSTAEDLLHTALASVLPRWETIRDPDSAAAYLRRAMVNQHHSWHRQPVRRRERPVAVLPEPPVAEPADPALSAEVRARLWALVLQLPPRQRAAVVLRHYEGMSEAETARALGCGVGTVKSSTSRGLATLRRQLAGDVRPLA